MKRLAELVVFVALAAGVHLAFALQWSAGSESGGVGGTELLSIEAASASVETMVARWERPPEVADISPVADAPVQADTPPPSAAPDLPVLRTAALALPSIPRADNPGRPDLSTPVAMPPPPVAAPQQMHAPTPPAAVIRPEARPAPRPEPAARPELQQVPPEAAPTAEMDTPEPPKPPEQTAQTPAKPAQTARPASTGQAKQRAAGSGGQSHAGSSGTAQAATLSQGQKARLASIWKAKVRARIERRKVRPNGRVSGTVHLKLTVTRDGRVLGVSVIKSSGVPAIDKAAVSSVTRAGRMPKAPKGLNDPSYGFRVPIEYK
ncbi:TonB family protein [Seohaeicola saemankumensis]|nr:TonB family protein [Seohaeicola saemankumensis]MCA0870057.1 TonB family protein [Seohaeicola saemankumensis]